MPSPIAHSVTGYCIGRLWPALHPSNTGTPLRRLDVGLAVFAGIAADFDFLPQLVTAASSHRGISHSFGVAILCSLALALLFGRRSRQRFLSVAMLAVAAYSSHLLLDLVTTGGRGIPLFWPLAPEMLVQVPFTLFPQVHHSEGLFYRGHLYFVLFESAYAFILLGITYLKTRRSRKTRSPAGVDG